MVIQVKGLVAALEAHQSVGLEGWWSELIRNLTAPPSIDDYRGNKNPWSREYTQLIKETFGNKRWVEELRLVDKDISAGGIASRLSGIAAGDYWQKVQTAIDNAQWLEKYADVIDAHSKAVLKIHTALFKAWNKGAGGINKPLWEKAIADMEALDDPLDWAGAHSKPGLDGKMVKVRNSAGWALSKPIVEPPKSLPALTKEQLDFAIDFIVKISNDEHRLSETHMELHRVALYTVEDSHEKIWEEMFELDDTLFSRYSNLTDYELVCDRLFKLVPGFRDHDQIAAALVLWVVRSTGSTGASLESFLATSSVSVESWWDTLVTAIVGVEDLDKYEGKKQPWSDEYKALVKRTFGNKRWVAEQVLIEGEVSGGGISKRLQGGFKSTDYLQNVQDALENSKWLTGYIKAVGQYSDEIIAIHKKTMEACKGGIIGPIVKQAIKDIEALEHPKAYVLKHGKTSLDGEIGPSKSGNGWRTTMSATKPLAKLPALNKEQFESAVKLINELSSGEHPIMKLEDEFYEAGRFLEIDGDDFWEDLQAFDENLYFAYTDVTYWQAILDDVYPPGLDGDTILAAMVIWCGRSTGKTAASLESFNGAGEITVEMIARTAHEAVRSLSQSFGDHSHESWEGSPEWVRESAINGAALHILNPELTAEQTHEAWLKARQEEGWACGPTKDADRKEHPCMVPYAELSREHRLKDHLFKATVDAFMACLREDNPDVQVVGLECACGSLEQQYEGSLVNKVLNSSVPV